MDSLQKAMQDEKFSKTFPDAGFGNITFKGKDIDGFYIVKTQVNIEGDIQINYFAEYDRMKKWLIEWNGEEYYDYIIYLLENDCSENKN